MLQSLRCIPMTRVLPTSGLVRRLQGAWAPNVATGMAPRARPCCSISAVLGGSGGSGAGGNGKGTGGNGGSGSGPSGGSSGSGGWGRSLAITLAGSVLLSAESALAAKKAPAPAKEEASDNTIEKTTDAIMALAGPVLSNLGFSGCVGAAAGVALKKLGQMVAVVLGLMFLMVQGLAYTGVVTVNWGTVHSKVINILDVNKDGKVDHNDFKPMLNEALAALSFGVPSVGGFLGGFMLALKAL